MNPKLIVIDGKSYNSVNEMPPDVRQKYEAAMSSLKDANGNRIPDALENQDILADQDKDGIPDMVENLTSENVVMSSMKIIVDGKEFNRIEDLPPDVRAKYEQALGAMDANRNGMPDFLEGMITPPKQNPSIASSFGTETTPHSAFPTYSPAIAPDTSNGLKLALAGLLILLLCAIGAAGIWYFFLR